MLLSISQAMIGLALISISWNSLKKSAIRKWRQGFTISLITGAMVLISGFAGLLMKTSLEINISVFFAAFSGMAFSVFLISKMHGLNA
ncbi:MAG: hypothetical protein PHS81_04510 [Candidatus Nanoarchaeia archaeon]|nr:hypothetical protein [Candidatus Nanoarchaeia archaeon]